jgi:hypothetical protein
MVVALALFLSQRHAYIHQTTAVSGNMAKTLRITCWLLLQQIYAKPWIAERFPWYRPGPMPVSRRLVSTSETEDRSGGDDDDDDDHEDSNDDESKQLVIDAAQALHAFPVLAMFPIFWCLYDQQGSVWTLQATRMALPAGMQPEQLQIVNPVESKSPMQVSVGKGYNISPCLLILFSHVVHSTF